MKLNQIEEELSALQASRRDAQGRVQEKDNQIRRYDDLIKQSEDALEKLYQNS